MQGCSRALRQPWGGFPCPIPPPCHLCSSLGAPFWAGSPPVSGRAVPKPSPCHPTGGRWRRRRSARAWRGSSRRNRRRRSWPRTCRRSGASSSSTCARWGLRRGARGPLGSGGRRGQLWPELCRALSPRPQRWVQRGALVCPRVSLWGPGLGSLLCPPPPWDVGAGGTPCREHRALHPRPPGPDPAPPLLNQGLAFGSKGDPFG